LVAVNQQPALRHATNNPQTGKGTRLKQTEGRLKKNGWEKVKRDSERYQLERISYLFRVVDPNQTWTRVNVLSFGEMVSLIDGFG
jgi:hypothetical protein